MNILFNKIEILSPDLSLFFPKKEIQKTDTIVFYLREGEYRLFGHVDNHNFVQHKSTIVQFAYFIIGFKARDCHITTYPYMFDHFQYNNGVVNEIYDWAMENQMDINRQKIIHYKNRAGSIGCDEYVIRFANEEDYIACRLRWG